MGDADVLAATRPAQVVVTCFGQAWPLQLSTATQWVGALGWNLDTLVGVLPGAIAEDQLDAMWEASRHDPVDAARRWTNAARVAVGRGGGRDWWWTVNMVRKVLGIWPYLNGQLLLRGVDAQTMPFPSWLDAAFMLLWTTQDELGRTKLEMELAVRPRGVAVRVSPQAQRKMVEDFAAD